VLAAQAPIETRPLRLEQRPVPEPARGEVLVSVLACGVCRTDLHVVEGDLPLVRSPIVPGHQVVGRVELAGRDATRFAVGERVGIAWLRATCGACGFCASGRENLCERAEFTGWHADGGFADYAVVPEAFAYRIPEAFTDAEAAPLLCAGGHHRLPRAQARRGPAGRQARHLRLRLVGARRAAGRARPRRGGLRVHARGLAA